MLRSAVSFILLLCAAPLAAGEARLALGAGVTEIDKVRQRAVGAVEAILPDHWGPVHPVAGFHINDAGDTYLYAGALAEWRLGERWRWNLGLCAGIYHYRGGYDLGGPLEFQSRISLERLLEGGRRAGLTVQHISSSSIYQPNPGSERVLLYLVVPLR